MKRSNNAVFFSTLLREWHEKTNERIMPWKGEKDPYKIWLSEIILQQTRVDQGLQYYLKFIKKFPTVFKLAAADDDNIFKMWEGLGYYSRCKNLIATARHISSALDGRFPTDYDEILKLKGVGPYTASAIASFAFDLPYAVVDGNVNRVLARYFGMHIPIDSTGGKKEFSALANLLLDKQNPGAYNQAIMDFGATVCKPRLPLCGQCLLALHCRAYHENTIDILPVKEKKIMRTARWFYYLVVQKEGSFFIRKRPAKDIWENLYEFVLLETAEKLSAAKVLRSPAGRAILTNNYRIMETTDFYKQSLTHQDIHGCFIHIQADDFSLPDDYRLVSKKDLGKLAFPRLLNDYLLTKGWGKK